MMTITFTADQADICITALEEHRDMMVDDLHEFENEEQEHKEKSDYIDQINDTIKLFEEVK